VQVFISLPFFLGKSKSLKSEVNVLARMKVRLIDKWIRYESQNYVEGQTFWIDEEDFMAETMVIVQKKKPPAPKPVVEEAKEKEPVEKKTEEPKEEPIATTKPIYSAEEPVATSTTLVAAKVRKRKKR
jgi:hypothetical protein